MKRFLPAVLVLFLLSVSWNEASGKMADLAGSWYTADPRALEAELKDYLDNADVPPVEGDIIGLVAPHAGFRYSGPVAAYAYKAALKQDPDLVVIVGFSHRKYSPWISVFTDESFVTPLGPLAVDQELSRKLMASNEKIQSVPGLFEQENSVEMEIPFVQVAFKNARAVLVAVGEQSRENFHILGDALYEVLRGEKNFIIIASTDMCHYLPYEEANTRDAMTIKAIKSFDPDNFYSVSLKNRHELMCGPGPVCATMLACKKLGADKVEILNYANSGDTSGMKDRVVGYLSAAFVRSGGRKAGEKPAAVKEGSEMFTQEQKDKLLKIARDTMRHYLETGKRLEVDVEDEALKEDMGAFVTLHEKGKLRGCIGHMVGTQPFYLTVRDMAIASATEDPRFPPVTAGELDDIDIEISALSPMRKIDDYNEINIPGQGVMVRMGFRSGVYLPQVAIETGWDRDQFMNSLCAHKAGIPMDAWKTGACDIYVFDAEVFGEKEK
ncbi:MAG: AmmeMemoRadiSam system protein B [Candidatus Omnitrophota bacterium]